MHIDPSNYPDTSYEVSRPSIASRVVGVALIILGAVVLTGGLIGLSIAASVIGASLILVGVILAASFYVRGSSSSYIDTYSPPPTPLILNPGTPAVYPQLVTPGYSAYPSNHTSGFGTAARLPHQGGAVPGAVPMTPANDHTFGANHASRPQQGASGRPVAMTPANDHTFGANHGSRPQQGASGRPVAMTPGNDSSRSGYGEPARQVSKDRPPQGETRDHQ